MHFAFDISSAYRCRASTRSYSRSRVRAERHLANKIKQRADCLRALEFGLGMRAALMCTVSMTHRLGEG